MPISSGQITIVDLFDGEPGPIGPPGNDGELNLVKNPAQTGTNEGWKGSTIPTYVSRLFSDGRTIGQLEHTSTGSHSMLTDTSFKVEPNKMYEISMWLQADVITGQVYIGHYAYDKNNANIGSYSIPRTTGVKGAANPNPYGISAQSPSMVFKKFTYYLLPAGIDISDANLVKELGLNNNFNFQMLSDTAKVTVRYLNWGNSVSFPKKLWMTHPVVKEVDISVLEANKAKNIQDLWRFAGTVEIDGGKLRANTVTATQISVASLSAISADLGTIVAGTISGVSSTMTSADGLKQIVTNPTDGFKIKRRNTTLAAWEDVFGIRSDGNVVLYGEIWTPATEQGGRGSFLSDTGLLSYVAGNSDQSNLDAFSLDFSAPTTSGSYGAYSMDGVHLEFGPIGSARDMYVDLDVYGLTRKNGASVKTGSFEFVNGEAYISGFQQLLGRYLGRQILADNNNGTVVLNAGGTNLVLGHANTQLVRSDSTLRMGAGKYIETNAIDNNPGDSGVHIYVRPASAGEVRATLIGTTGTYVPMRASEYRTGSSREYKTNITDHPDTALQTILGLSIKEYDLIADLERGETNNRQIGVISEDSPCVSTPDGKAINTYKMLSLAVKGIQELYTMIGEVKDAS